MKHTPYTHDPFNYPVDPAELELSLYNPIIVDYREYTESVIPSYPTIPHDVDLTY